MRARVVASEVEAHRRREVAGLHLVVDALDVDAAARRDAEVFADAGELLLEARDVVAVGVEAGEVAPFEEREYLVRALRERRAVLHHVVGDSVHGGRLRRDRNPGVEEPALRLLRSVGHHLYRAELDYAVLLGEQPRRLEVEHDERPV